MRPGSIRAAPRRGIAATYVGLVDDVELCPDADLPGLGDHAVALHLELVRAREPVAVAERVVGADFPLERASERDRRIAWDGLVDGAGVAEAAFSRLIWATLSAPPFC